MFEKAQSQIFQLMKYDSYTRFLKSNVYKDCIMSEMEGKSIPFTKQQQQQQQQQQHQPPHSHHVSTNNDDRSKTLESLVRLSFSIRPGDWLRFLRRNWKKRRRKIKNAVPCCPGPKVNFQRRRSDRSIRSFFSIYQMETSIRFVSLHSSLLFGLSFKSLPSHLIDLTIFILSSLSFWLIYLATPDTSKFFSHFFFSFASVDPVMFCISLVHSVFSTHELIAQPLNQQKKLSDSIHQTPKARKSICFFSICS